MIFVLLFNNGGNTYHFGIFLYQAFVKMLQKNHCVCDHWCSHHFLGSYFEGKNHGQTNPWSGLTHFKHPSIPTGTPRSQENRVSYQERGRATSILYEAHYFMIGPLFWDHVTMLFPSVILWHRDVYAITSGIDNGIVAGWKANFSYDRLCCCHWKPMVPAANRS